MALRWGRLWAVSALVLGSAFFSLAAPGASLAATVRVIQDQPPGPPRLLVEDNTLGGEVNTITVDLSGCLPANNACTGGTWTVTDTTTAPTAIGPQCAPAGSGTVTCAAAGTNRAAVDAGSGDDSVTMNAVAPSPSFIRGENGNDTLTGGAGPDNIFGGAGNDNLAGGAGDDNLFGGPGSDQLLGEAGNDVLDPGTVTPVDPAAFADPDYQDACTARVPGFDCPDTIDGGAGFNTMQFSEKNTGPDAGPVVVDARSGGSNGNFVTDPTHDNFLLVRPFLNIFKIIGTNFNDQIYGGAEDDTLVGAGGADVLCGGYGNDTVDYSGSPGPVHVTLDGAPPGTPGWPDPRWGSNDGTEQGQAPHDCRQTSNPTDTTRLPGTSYPPSDLPWAQNPADPSAKPLNCTADDGGQADLDPTTGKHDCVGPDVENVIGSPYDDVLIGNDPGPFVDKAGFIEPRGNNVLDGGGGDDVLDGRGGSDVLIGGPSGPKGDTVDYSWETKPVTAQIGGGPTSGSADDLNPGTGTRDTIMPDVENIIGGSGDDTLSGSAADNNIVGGPGNDTIQGDSGNDTLDGQGGNDTVLGGDGNDTVDGGPGNDVLSGGRGADTIDGGDGTDTGDYSTATTPVFAANDGAANDGESGEGDNVSNVEGFIGGSSNDVLVGSGVGGTLAGGPGDDTLQAGAGSGTITGGPGLDTVSYAGHNGGVTVDLAAGTGPNGDVIAGDVEGVTGGDGNDTISGSDAVNVLSGGGGNDTINGRGGDDQIFGGAGNDKLFGGDGNDKLSGGDGNDSLDGGPGADVLNGDAGDDSLDGGLGPDVLAGGPGMDVADYSSRTKNVSVTMDGADNDGQANEGDQIRSTTEGARTGSGNDTIDVKDGVAGEVSCGKGNDTVTADPIDVIGGDCENVGISSVCSVRQNSVTMSGNGVVGIRLTCLASAKGTLTLKTVGAYKAAKKTRKKVVLGRKKFSLKAGRSAMVKVRLSKKARRLVKRNKKLHVRATISAKRSATARATNRSKSLTIKAPKRKR
jgi:Ca2+-binding RTX toxin-like protein